MNINNLIEQCEEDGSNSMREIADAKSRVEQDLAIENSVYCQKVVRLLETLQKEQREWIDKNRFKSDDLHEIREHDKVFAEKAIRAFGLDNE